jgi:hypothetical protein
MPSVPSRSPVKNPSTTHNTHALYISTFIMDLNQIEDDLIDDAIFQAVINTVQTQMVDKPPRERMMTRQLGHDYIHELLGCKSQERIRRALRMNSKTFYTLRDWLVKNTALKATKYITIEEKLAIFLHIVSRPASNQDTAERFSHSGYTITK